MDTHTLLQLLGEGTVQTLIMTLVGTLVSYNWNQSSRY